MPSVPTDFAAGAFAPERLADRLAAGRLPLHHALRCGADLALNLRDLHAARSAHGSVTPVFVALEPARAVLIPAPGSAATASADGDARAFGAVLYEMLVGRKPDREAFAPSAVRSPYHGAMAEVYQSALGIAEKCMAGAPGSAPNLQNVANQLRLLLLIANRASAARPPEARPPAPPAAGPAILPQPAPGDEEDWSDEDWDDLTDQVCPHCSARNVHYSSLGSSFEHLLGYLGIPFYRCHKCFHRYMMFLGIRVTMGDQG